MNPFSENRSDTVASLGESELINRIRGWLGEASPQSPQGIGDDCAALDIPREAEKFLITTDPVIYGQHFDDQISPEDAGAKLAKRNLSDIAAMGGKPFASVVSLSIPNNLQIGWLERFYTGLGNQALKYQFTIAGGDVSQADSYLGIFMTMTGTSAGKALERGKAIAESSLYVTGELGGSILGKHHRFEPRLAEGQWLASRDETLGCMDLSDGLGKDCSAMLRPDHLAKLDCSRLPISEDAVTLSRSSGKSPLYHAINDGEDFELLFALSPKADPNRFAEDWSENFTTKLTRIGSVEATTDPKDLPIQLENTDEKIPLTGYEHLRAT